jgi:hypothetical protein
MASETDERQATRPDGSWLHARELWAGLSIITMLLAVLLVGLFGGDIVNTSAPGGSTSSISVVVALLPFVLPATIVAARRGFTSVPIDRQHGGEEQRGADEGTRAHEETTPERSPLRAKPA